MTARGTRVPNRINHSSSMRDGGGGGARRGWDGAPPPSTLLSGGFEVVLSGVKIGFTNPGPGVNEDDLRLRYRPEAECISFEGPNSRGMLVPLEEMLLKDNLDGTISVFFRRQFRRKYYILEGGPPRVCEHIQAYKNELNIELHMLCFVTGYDSLNNAAAFVRRVRQGRQGIPLAQRSTDFPSYATYRHPQYRDLRALDNPPQPQYRRGSFYSDPEMTERYPGVPLTGNPERRVRFRDHPPPPVPQPPLPMQTRTPLRGGAGPSFRDYDLEEQFVRDRLGNGDSDGDQFVRGAPLGRDRSRSRDRNGFEPREPRSRKEADGFEMPTSRPVRSRSALNVDRNGLFEPPSSPPPPPPPPPPQKRMFALVFRKSPADQGVEIRPASIDSTHEALMRQASSHWNLRELKLYGSVDGLKMNLNSQVDLDAYMKLCDGIQRLMIDVE